MVSCRINTDRPQSLSLSFLQEVLHYRLPKQCPYLPPLDLLPSHPLSSLPWTRWTAVKMTSSARWTCQRWALRPCQQGYWRELVSHQYSPRPPDTTWLVISLVCPCLYTHIWRGNGVHFLPLYTCITVSFSGLYTVWWNVLYLILFLPHHKNKYM